MISSLSSGRIVHDQVDAVAVLPAKFRPRSATWPGRSPIHRFQCWFPIVLRSCWASGPPSPPTHPNEVYIRLVALDDAPHQPTLGFRLLPFTGLHTSTVYFQNNHPLHHVCSRILRPDPSPLPSSPWQRAQRPPLHAKALLRSRGKLLHLLQVFRETYISD
jgi:hypothetical protein